MRTFDQSLKYLLAHEAAELLAFALDDPEIEVIAPVKTSLPARERDVDGGFRVRMQGSERVVHVEFHRRKRTRQNLAVDVAEAQIRLFRRERAEIVSLVWDLYGERDGAVLSLWQSALYQHIFGKGVDEGELRGKVEGKLEGERRAVSDLCDVLGIALTPEREAWVQGLDLPQLGELRAHLKQCRAWPSTPR